MSYILYTKVTEPKINRLQCHYNAAWLPIHATLPQSKIHYRIYFTTRQSWHERVLVLRDTWTEACQGGVSSLEVYHPPTNISTSTSTPTSTPTKPSSTQTFSFFSCISKKPNKFDTNSFSRLHHNSLPKHHHKHQIDHCYIDLSTVSSVDKHPSNKSFPHAFVLHRWMRK